MKCSGTKKRNLTIDELIKKVESQIGIETDDKLRGELRNKLNLTQQDLADAVDVTRATIIALEKGNYNPSLELAFRLAKFFKTGIEEIFFE